MRHVPHEQNPYFTGRDELLTTIYDKIRGEQLIGYKHRIALFGLGGVGKTQLALRFGDWLGVDRVEVIPVRPDWTGSEALFGYENALVEKIAGKAAWHVPGALRFMLKAAADQSNAYVLILDEMNLAHVERYFADFLEVNLDGRISLIPYFKRYFIQRSRIEIL